MVTIDHNGKEVEVVEVARFKGVAFEEDIEQATEQAIKFLGAQGSFKYPAVAANHALWAAGLGFIWYGDVRQSELNSSIGKIVQLAKTLNRLLVLVPEATKGYFYGKVNLTFASGAHQIASFIVLSDGTVSKNRWGN